MSNVKLSPSSLSGDVKIPPSKSVAHRALICSFLAGGGDVSPITESKDMQATVGVIDALKKNETILDCIESGSTMRFMIPVAAALGRNVTFTGQGSLLSRTVGEYLELLPIHNVSVESSGTLPLKLSGQLQNGSFEVSGDVSSQYVTGLLLGLASLQGDSAIIMKTPLQSKPYVDITVKVMADYGVKIRETDFGYLIKGGQEFKKLDYIVEGDWSHAAFFLVAGAIGSGVTVSGLDMHSAQGDKMILNVLEKFGAKVKMDSDGRVVCSGGDLKGTEIDAHDIPDLVPIIAVLAAYSSGKTVIKGAERLRYKESDRIQSVVSNLKAMGVEVSETADGMIIEGGALRGARLKGYNDHRIVMAFSVAALFADGETVIDDAQSINKSYPTFFEDYNRLGGKASVL